MKQPPAFSLLTQRQTSQQPLCTAWCGISFYRSASHAAASHTTGHLFRYGGILYRISCGEIAHITSPARHFHHTALSNKNNTPTPPSVLPPPPYPFPASYTGPAAAETSLDALGVFQAHWLRGAVPAPPEWPVERAAPPPLTATSAHSSSWTAESSPLTSARQSKAADEQQETIHKATSSTDAESSSGSSSAPPSASLSSSYVKYGIPTCWGDWEAYAQHHGAGYLPQLSDLMAAPPHEVLQEFALRRPYHTVLQLVMEQGVQQFSFLLDFIFGSQDAPLPHVIYQDVMKVCTFSSHQLPPESQFQLPTRFRLFLLSTAARTCVSDKYFFTQAQMLFRRMEQQQSLRGMDYSAFVWMCAAGEELDTCMQTLMWMCSRDMAMPFSPVIYSLLLHPSVDIVQVHYGYQPHVLKGLLLQQRLAKAWGAEPVSSFSLENEEDSFTVPQGKGEKERGRSASSPTGGSSQRRVGLTTQRLRARPYAHHHCFAVGVHAVFVHYCLTLKHRLKWEWLSMALSKEYVVSSAPSEKDMSENPLRERSNDLESEVNTPFAAERSAPSKGVLCHPSLGGVYRVSDRTLRLALEVFAAEKGAYCSAMDVKYVFLALLHRGHKIFQPTAAETGTTSSVSLPSALLFLLMRIRRNEIQRRGVLQPQQQQHDSNGVQSEGRNGSQEPLVYFSPEEVEYCTVQLQRHREAQIREAAALRHEKDPFFRVMSPQDTMEEGDQTSPRVFRSVASSTNEVMDSNGREDFTFRLVAPLLRGLMTSSLTGEATTARPASSSSAVSERRSSEEDPTREWGALLQHCALFGREVLNATTTSSLSDANASATSPSPSTVVHKTSEKIGATLNTTSVPVSRLEGTSPSPSHGSRLIDSLSPLSLAHARLLFQELRLLDRVRTARDVSLDKIQREGHGSPSPSSNTVLHVEAADLAHEAQVQATLRRLEQQGAARSQRCFTEKVLEQEREEKRLKQLLSDAWTTL